MDVKRVCLAARLALSCSVAQRRNEQREFACERVRSVVVTCVANNARATSPAARPSPCSVRAPC
eukprot:140992-Lingulodinium_polyedra.AAC.1